MNLAVAFLPYSELDLDLRGGTGPAVPSLSTLTSQLLASHPHQNTVLPLLPPGNCVMNMMADEDIVLPFSFLVISLLTAKKGS